MPKLVDKINQKLAKQNLEVRTKESREWLRKNLSSLRPNPMQLLRDKNNKFVRRVLPGKMYFYNYDPKLKEVLPFYDMFPLVIPIKKYSDGFLGLNLHYLPVKYRTILLDKLYDVFNNDKYDETSKLRISYNMLDGTTKYREFSPCVKRYLSSHINSRVIEIMPDDWEIVATLPIEKFIGAKKNTVQKLSIQSIYGHGI